MTQTTPRITMREMTEVPENRSTPTSITQNLRGMDRLRRDRAATDPSQQRRMSRVSTVSTTPTAVEGPTSSSQSQGPTRPSIKEVVRKHPRNIVYISILLILFIGGIVGWAIYLSLRPVDNDRRDGFRGGLIINGLFIVILIVIFLLASRQAIFIYRLFHPIPPHRSPTLPPWLVGRPPTYSESLRGRGTGDVEDNIIAQNENLPKYGETRGSTLLARSQSRGGAVGREEAERISMEEVQARQAASALDTARVEAAEGDSRPPPANQEEAERRQIEDARRYQAAAGYSGTDEKTSYVRPGEDQPQHEERWEEVALDRDARR